MVSMIPVISAGHGSPMIALEDNDLTRTFKDLGQDLMEKYHIQGIICLSAHWYGRGTRVQAERKPRQIYDMRGFPDELYRVKYEPPGSSEIARDIVRTLDMDIEVDNSWGIDHGAWTILIHMFPKADIPLVQVSIDEEASYGQMFEIGKKLGQLRKRYLILGSGNVVHNLWKLDWSFEGGRTETKIFDSYVRDRVLASDYESLLEIKDHELYGYCVPSKDHFAPLPYVLGAALDSRPRGFNETYRLGTVSMTSYIFE